MEGFDHVTYECVTVILLSLGKDHMFPHSIYIPLGLYERQVLLCKEVGTSLSRDMAQESPAIGLRFKIQ
jgi:hypothetical protein